MNYTTWAKANKKQLVMKVVGNSKPRTSVDQPTAVFAAGIPGAGKTEFLNRLLDDAKNVVRIDMDEIVTMFPEYSPERYYEYRTPANIIVDEAVIYCRQHNLDFVLDGTFGSSKAVENVRHALKRHIVVVFYVWKEPELAWKHTQDRQLVTKRGVEKAGFIDSCLHVPTNIKSVREKFGDKLKLIAVRKSPENDNFEVTENNEIIDDLIEVKYSKDDLERTLI